MAQLTETAGNAGLRGAPASIIFVNSSMLLRHRAPTVAADTILVVAPAVLKAGQKTTLAYALQTVPSINLKGLKSSQKLRSIFFMSVLRPGATSNYFRHRIRRPNRARTAFLIF